MHKLRLLFLALVAVCASSTLARPRMIPIKSSFIGAAASSNPASFLRVGSKVFFSANDGTHGQELWVTDGTAAGTTFVADLNPGSGGSGPTMVGSISGAAIFTAYDSSTTNALFRSDGTAGGTIKLMTIPPSLPSSVGYTVTAVAADTRVFVLVRQNSGSPVEIFVSDGTVGGTADLGAFPVDYPAPIGANGNLYFAGQDSTIGAQLWVSDGTVLGTHMVDRGVECPGTSCGPSPGTFFRIGATALFVATDGLWKTDGSAAGTQRIASIPYAGLVASSPTSPIAYVAALGGILWKTDGTAAGTQQTGTYPTLNSGPPPIVLDDGRLIFYHYTGNDYEVWKSDGTTAGTVKIGNISTNYPFLSLTVGMLGNRVLLEGSGDTTGTELWLADIDAGTVSLLKDIDARVSLDGPSSGVPGPGIALGSTFLFAATDLAGRELWQTDGTAAGTRLLANIASDPGGGVVSGTARAASDGTPIAGAAVALCAPSGNGPCDTTLADGNGFYHFDGVIPGTYSVASNAYFYITQFYEGVNCPCTIGGGTPVTVTSGLETAGVDFSLIRGATIAGSIKRASTGLPIPDVEILIRDATGRLVDDQFTDPSGHYQSRGLTTGTYYAETLKHQYIDFRPAVNQVYHNHDCVLTACDWHVGDGISLTNSVDTTGIDFSLHEYGTIAGTVRDDAGTPVSGLSVYFLRQGATSANVWVNTDANGQYLSPLLNPGSYYVVTGGTRGFNVIVYQNGTCSSTFNCTPTGGTLVTLPVDGAATGIDIQLSISQSRLAGTIRDSNGAPFSGVSVVMLDSSGNYRVVPASTDAAGHYEFSIAAGTYYLQAVDQVYPGIDCFSSPCNVAGATPLVLTNGHSTRADMQLLSQWTKVSGHLLDAVSGQPIPGGLGFLVWVNAAGYSGNTATTSYDGSYQISTVSRDPAFYLAASNAGYHRTIYQSARWECANSPCPPTGATPIPAGTNTNIDFLMPRTAWVSGTVTDAATGSPIQNVEILFNLTGSASAVGVGFTDAAGHYKSYLAPGQYNSYAAPYGFISYQPQVYHDHNCASTCNPTTGEVITLTDGVETTAIDFHLAPQNLYATISGHVLDAVTGQPMAGVTVNVLGSGFSSSTDAQGFYSISHDNSRGLASGQYAMYAEAQQPYFVGLSGGGNCPDFSTCYGTGTPVHITAPKTTTVDFQMIRLHVTSVSPAFGPTSGGTHITISGANFTPSATVMVGGHPATVISITPTQIVAITPLSTAGAAHVTVTLSSSLAVTFVQGFTYIATTFTDDPLVVGVTVIKAAHILELRAAVNRLRATALLADFPFTDPTLAGVFVKATHVVELRTALNQARAALGLSTLTYTNTIASGTPIRAVDITEIRNATR